jgi:hypothetical protein
MFASRSKSAALWRNHCNSIRLLDDQTVLVPAGPAANFIPCRQTFRKGFPHDGLNDVMI